MGTRNFYLNKEKIITLLVKYGIDNSEEEYELIEKEVNTIISRHCKKQRIAISEIYNKGIPLKEIYPDIDEKQLPSWILKNISSVKVIGTSKQTLILPDGRKYQLNNVLNHLSGGEWVYFTNSVINTNYHTSGEDSYAHNIRKIHPTPKPPQLMKDIITFFTKENDIVFDYFMGVGGSLLGAALCGRRAIGIDLNKKYIDAYKAAAKELGLEEFVTIRGDSLSILADDIKMNELLNGEKIGLILIDPPYANMMNRKKTGADIDIYGNIATPFTNDNADLGNLELEAFFNALRFSVEKSMKYLKRKGYIVIFMKDLQPHKKNLNLLHADIIQALNEIPNIQYKGLKIWADQTSKLFPYGYPFSFVANQIHQYILIFRKEK